MSKKYMPRQNKPQAKSRGKVLQTTHGTFNLAHSRDRKLLRSIIVGLQRAIDALTKKDIGDWRKAWQLAVNIDNPDRRWLYDIYRDTLIDSHLSGCIDQRRGFVMSRSFKLVDAKGKENKEAMHYFDQAWFKQLMRLALDSVWWGYSLIELGGVTVDGRGRKCYESVSLIPRKHVIPEYHSVVINEGENWRSGIDYLEAPICNFVIAVGQPDDLGVLLKAAPQTIAKKYALAYWDEFAEIFGMPMRVAHTTSRDAAERERISRELKNSGRQQVAVVPSDTEIQFVESSRGDAYNVYNQRVARANSEISKLTIGQTMTIEDGSSLSQSETHLQVLENLVEADCDMLRDMINNQLIPRMIMDGFPLKGLHFEWDYAVDYTPEQQVAYETMIADRYEVNPSYFAEKYNMPVGQRRNTPGLLPAKETDEEREERRKREDKMFATLDKIGRVMEALGADETNRLLDEWRGKKDRTDFFD